MTKVKVYNDMKEKWQSFEVWIDDIDCDRGYGHDEISATKNYIENLKDYTKNLVKMKTKVDESLNALNNYDFIAFRVNFMGEEVDGK